MTSKRVAGLVLGSNSSVANSCCPVQCDRQVHALISVNASFTLRALDCKSPFKLQNLFCFFVVIFIDTQLCLSLPRAYGVPGCSYEDAGGVLSWVEQKIASVTLLPVSHGEVRLGAQHCADAADSRSPVVKDCAYAAGS
jgi:hypothetical protein